MKTKEMTVYITKDNKKFFDEGEAKLHEERLLNMKAFEVHYQPDLTETGNLARVGYLIVEAKWSSQMWAEDWLYKEFGNRVAFVQGVSPTWNWTINSTELSKVDKKKLLAHLNK